MLFDSSIRQILLEKGIKKSVGMDNLPGTRPVDLDNDEVSLWPRQLRTGFK